ncbi:EAL domain-containing protein [Gulbenkiania mobilis]|uniref:EAL domain-containing protein (Putative c-di-GMP-specific phosphodiesterase class I) n=1 Tax=Gulbenkiania mobilis TaxID=397457 RepID=A0ABY2CYI7_GULMO|nr:EAL domain-containing protein (putative c-di-GMP-specific phosphodiesterase class I) [Gulbenkiania mobilis]
MTLSSINAAAPACRQCEAAPPLGFEFTMAFQPIVDVERREVFAYEALVRGLAGEPAADILAQVNDDNRYRFDQVCRVKAVALAARAGLTAKLSINFMPNAVYNAATCIRATLQAAAEHGFPVENIIFEVAESEKATDQAHLKSIIAEYQRRGFATAIDDFGSGYSGLNFLADFQPDFIKLDMALVRNLHLHPPRQSIVRHLVTLAHELNIQLVAEGVETVEEFGFLRGLGIRLFQGFLFARPAFETFEPVLDWPD